MSATAKAASTKLHVRYWDETAACVVGSAEKAGVSYPPLGSKIRRRTSLAPARLDLPRNLVHERLRAGPIRPGGSTAKTPPSRRPLQPGRSSVSFSARRGGPTGQFGAKVMPAQYAQGVEPKRWFRAKKHGIHEGDEENIFPSDDSYRTWIDNFQPIRRFKRSWR